MGFIIVFIGIIWFFVPLIFISDEQEEVNPIEITNYIEKIDKFILQGFNQKQQLTHFIEAEKYYSFKEYPALLVEPKVIFYNKKGEELYTMTSKKANYLSNGEIKFQGKVDVNSKMGAVYKMNAKELLVNAETNNLSSDKQVVYLDKKAQVTAQGMTMKSTENKMQFLGKVAINQDSGQKILTRDLFIDQSKSQKHYYSKYKTTYLASNNKIYSQGLHMNATRGISTLLGKVKILQKSGVTIDTKKLVIEQSKGHEIYHTKEKVHYTSGVLNIRAKQGMRYDVKDQKVKLTGGVEGRYE